MTEILSTSQPTRTSNGTDYAIIVPQHLAEAGPDQDEEWVIVDHNDRLEKVQFHDYARIFEQPGLYEKLFYEKLHCQSPEVLTELLLGAVKAAEDDPGRLRVLDFGAGNGMVAEALIARAGVPLHLVGSDILPEARAATLRDRPGIYADYIVADFSQLSPKEWDQLRSHRFNVLITVAALGFDDIPPQALVNAFNLLEVGGWFAFNLRDKFCEESADSSGFANTLTWLTEDQLEVFTNLSYVHRYSISGEPLHYRAFVGRKRAHIGN